MCSFDVSAASAVSGDKAMASAAQPTISSNRAMETCDPLFPVIDGRLAGAKFVPVER